MHGRSRSPRLGREGRFQNAQLLAPCRSSGCLCSHTSINMIERILPRRKEMRVRARKHVRNEGSRRFKSTPLRQRVWLLRQSPGNSTKCPPLLVRFEPPTYQSGAAAQRRSVWRDGEVPGAGDQRRLIREDPDHACAPPKLRWAIWVACNAATPVGAASAHCHDRRQASGSPFTGARSYAVDEGHLERGFAGNTGWLPRLIQPNAPGCLTYAYCARRLA